MPGRPLRRARQDAVAALTEQQARDLATLAVPHIERDDAVAILAANLPRDTPLDLLIAVAALTLGAARRHLTDLVTHNDSAARSTLRSCARHPEVERALGLTRHPGQQAPDQPTRIGARIGAPMRHEDNQSRPVTPVVRGLVEGSEQRKKTS